MSGLLEAKVFELRQDADRRGPDGDLQRERHQVGEPFHVAPGMKARTALSIWLNDTEPASGRYVIELSDGRGADTYYPGPPVAGGRRHAA